MARIRSPNYPQIGLPAAIERVRSIYKAERQNRIDREVAAKLMGFGGYNGASAGVLSAVLKYGLLEVVDGGELKVSNLAERLLVPHDEAEQSGAALEAALKPPLFVELNERWPSDRPSDHSLRSYLIRRGFAEVALDSVIRSYAETLDFVGKNQTHNQSEANQEEASDESALPVSDEPDTQAVRTGAGNALPVVGPSLNIVRTAAGYKIYLGGAVESQAHVDEVVSMLTALRMSLPAKIDSSNLENLIS